MARPRTRAGGEGDEPRVPPVFHPGIPRQDVAQFMAAALPVAALASRVAHDSAFTTQIVDAAHAGDAAAIDRVIASAGVTARAGLGDPVVAARAAPAAPMTPQRGGHIDIDVGPVHIHIGWSK